MLQKWICTSRTCKWQSTQTAKSAVGEKVSPELLKVQAELGAKNTYRKSADMLRLMVGGRRRINNHNRISKTTNRIGEHVEKLRSEQILEGPANTVPATEIVLSVDGGHIHDSDNPGHNFEAMVAKIFKPENIVPISKGKNVIKEKHCVGSAKDDKQETMKRRVHEACIREGLTERTTIVALADGAKNCWNIINSLAPICFSLTCILDWFHIGKYAQNLKSQLPSQYQNFIDSAKTELWYGRSDLALSILEKFQEELKSDDYKKKVENFSAYIKGNVEYIVDYSNRDKDGLIYTSHIAESTVEHYINQRFKKKQKMQWKRKNAHAVLQVRASIVDKSWDTIWKKSANELFKCCA